MFQFNGDWETQIKLAAYSFLNHPEYCRNTGLISQGIFTLDIMDVRNENPDPELYQVNTIDFIQDPVNQAKLLSNLLAYSRDAIYPHYQEFMWQEEYPESYPTLEKTEDLHKLYGIDRILIKTIEKDNFAYFIFECSSCLDYEHGIKITFYKNQVIDHGEDWDDQKVCEHKGIDYTTYHQQETKDYNKRALKLTEPHPKYGKLKPYQRDQNDYYPFDLYHAGEDESLVKVLSEQLRIKIQK